MKSNSKYIAPRLFGLTERIAFKVRSSIYNGMDLLLKPREHWKVLDVGVTNDNSFDSNFFEKKYPYKNKITAVGLEDASFLEKKYKGLKFFKANALNLPFEDNYFDLAFCSAVIEHVGSYSNQIQCVKELSRVSDFCLITTPNKSFPLEFHTLTFFLHWLPPRLFRYFLRLTGRKFFSYEANLNLLNQIEIERIFDKLKVNYMPNHIKFLGMKTNLVYIISKNNLNNLN